MPPLRAFFEVLRWYAFRTLTQEIHGILISDDWTPEPEFIATLRKPALRNLAKRIARLWRDLSRKIKEDVKDNSSLYSIIYVPNGFVVPGGEFFAASNHLLLRLISLGDIHKLRWLDFKDFWPLQSVSALNWQVYYISIVDIWVTPFLFLV